MPPGVGRGAGGYSGGRGPHGGGVRGGFWPVRGAGWWGGRGVFLAAVALRCGGEDAEAGGAVECGVVDREDQGGSVGEFDGFEADGWGCGEGWGVGEGAGAGLFEGVFGGGWEGHHLQVRGVGQLPFVAAAVPGAGGLAHEDAGVVVEGLCEGGAEAFRVYGTWEVDLYVDGFRFGGLVAVAGDLVDCGEGDAGVGTGRLVECGHSGSSLGCGSVGAGRAVPRAPIGALPLACAEIVRLDSSPRALVPRAL